MDFPSSSCLPSHALIAFKNRCRSSALVKRSASFLATFTDLGDQALREHDKHSWAQPQLNHGVTNSVPGAPHLRASRWYISLPMSDRLDQALREHFSFDRFKPGQREVMERLLAGDSAAAVFPTGGGKSLCYQLPALMLPGMTLVVSPLIALMKDQIDALAARGIAARRLDSSLGVNEYRAVMEQARAGSLRMLYVAPERFNNERFRGAIQRLPVSLFAVDEAHCISEWGHNFRPDYLKLAGFARLCGAERVLALTATATEKVLADICREFGIRPGCAIRTGFYRPNLTVLATPVEENQRDARLLARLHERPRGPTIIYVTLQRTAESLAKRLAKAGFPANPYHAGMKDEERAGIQDAFMHSDDGLVVATIAFGMGVDKADIRYVYHYNPPKSLENFSQEIGRAGRNGKKSICEMFVCTADLNVLENFAYGDTPSLAAVRSLISELFSQGERFHISLHQLSFDHDIRLLVTRTLLTYLELDGYLEGGTPFYASYQFKPLLTSRELLARFEGERRAFLARMLRLATQGRTWFHIDIEEVAAATGATRERVVRALDYLSEQQMLEVRSSGIRYRFQRLRLPEDLDDLATRLHQRMLRREAAEIGRLQEVLDLAGLDACQVAALAAHFGETLEQPCGHCSWCLNDRIAAPMPQRRAVAIDESTWQQVRTLRREHPEILSDPRAMTRFLCGVSSPRLSRARLQSHPLFGTLADVPFREVLSRVQ